MLASGLRACKVRALTNYVGKSLAVNVFAPTGPNKKRNKYLFPSSLKKCG
jgi:hypothetical protein